MTRVDSRNFNQIRKIKFTRNFIKHAEGSCLIELGDTKVICTASVEESLPVFLRGKNSGWITAEYGMLPRSTETRIQRDRISGRTFEIQRLIARALRSVVDLNKLGERTVWVDCDVMQADGGTRTASITGGFIALADCLANMKEEGRIKEMPILHYLAAISVGIFEQNLILDLNYYEDCRAEIDMNVVMNSDFELVEIQGTAEKGSFSKKVLDSMHDLARLGVKEIIKAERDLLKDILVI
ncbi:MAG: ribonuclease PH [Candidatus Omnitrophica bacterium]|nr:ribonuclease PH [Candidatus Omnitrophota bacterium]